MTDLKPPLEGYSLWLEADRENQEALQLLTDDLARSFNTNRFLAHATLLGLLDKDAGDETDIRAACSELAKDNQAIAAELIGVAVRDAHFQCIFMPIVPVARLVTMNQKARHLLGHEMDSPFMPHWSVVYGDLGRLFKSAMVSAAHLRVTFPRVIQLQTLALADVHGYPDEWKVIERYPFGGK